MQLIVNFQNHILNAKMRKDGRSDEDIDDIRTTTPAAQVAPSPTEAALPQVAPPQDAPLQAAPPPPVVTTTPDVISYQGPITRARARELNFVTMLKNDGPEG